MLDERPWFELDDDEVVALATDELALRILIQIGTGSENRFNAVMRMERDSSEAVPREAAQAATEAWWWLIRKGLIVPDPPDDGSWLRSRLGDEIVRAGAEGLRRLSSTERIDVDVHPRIAADVRAEFLRGKFETAVFTAMREVEIALREKSRADHVAYGQSLVNFAFGKGGTLIDASTASAEEQAVGNLFRGAIGSFKNPPSHRRVDFDDPTEAAEIVLFASLLLRILDRLPEP
jgi:uncharacterized protein (TIGR02391 family)